jgi:ATP-binding cassette subfamily B multidrug efflux pump
VTFLKKYVNKYWKPFTVALLCLMLEAACDLAQPTIMSKVVDVGVKGKNINYILQFGVIMLMVTAIGALGAISRNIVSSNVSQKFGAELRSDLFKKIQSFSFENIDNFKTASLITRLTNDVTQVQNFINGLMRIFVKAPLLCIGSIVMASFLNWRMALILTAIIPVVGILIFLSIKIGYPYFSKVQKGIDRVNGVMREYLAGVRVVKAFNRFDFETERFAGSNRVLSNATATAMRVMSIFSPGISLSVNIGIVAVLWLGGSYVNTGHVLVGQVIAFVNYMTQILMSLMMITFVFNAFIRAKTSMDRIEEVMLEENSMKLAGICSKLPGTVAGSVSCPPMHSGPVIESVNCSPMHPQPVVDSVSCSSIHPDSQGGVEFEDVTFSYTGASGVPVLEHITFKCRPGETIGIIGSTGAGKSSLVNLIPRFYDVTSGCVRVDGADVRAVGQRELREIIAVVPQKTVLFSGSVLDNIKWGREDADKTAVEKAAKAAQAHEFISAFPEGYDTLLGQGGVNLSGGQKQRIALARALVREPRILILDDCTSAVDIMTEAKIREALKEYSERLSCFIISQRISSMMTADRIIVLDNGNLSGLGTHEELMRSCNVYREIYRSQIGREGMQDE